MPLRVLIPACAVAVLLAAAPAGAAVPQAARAPRATVRLLGCHQGLDPARRSIKAMAVIRRIPGAERLGLRFDLLGRARGAPRFSVVHGPGLGVWNRSDAGVGRYRYFQQVENLAAPASYRLRVRFRWYGRGGRVLRTAHRVTRICRQPDLRADLRVRRFAGFPVLGRPGLSRYVLVVRNAGATAAGPFQISFAFPALDEPVTRALAGLAAGAERRLAFRGPACAPEDPPTVTLDSTGAVAERNEANDVRAALCASG